MSYNTKNYTEQGGEKTVIGGTLEFTADAKVVNFPAGSITPAATQADSTASTVSALKEDFNALLAKLKAAGLMAVPAPAQADTPTTEQTETADQESTPSET